GQLPPRRGQVIGISPVALEAAPDDHAPLLQFLQPLAENGWRDAGQSALQDIEPAAAQQQFADDEDRPRIADDLGGFGDRTELTILAHRVCLACRTCSVNYAECS